MLKDFFCGASPGSEPACLSAIISSAWSLSLIKMTFSLTLLGRLMWLTVLKFRQSYRLHFLGSVIFSDWSFSSFSDRVTDLC